MHTMVYSIFRDIIYPYYTNNACAALDVHQGLGVLNVYLLDINYPYQGHAV